MIRSLAILSLLLSWALRSAGAESRPHILFLLSDDHSYPGLSAYGDPNVRTPVLDRLAAEGMKFHRFFTAAPQCVPSRAALLSGRSPVAARMTRFTSPLPADVITFPEVLRSAGHYYTGICGRSYHLDGPGKGRDAATGALLDKHKLRTFSERVDFLRTGPDKGVAPTVAEFLDSRPADRPFFLWANFSDPHHPWTAGPELRPDPASLKLPAHFPDLPGMRAQFADYCGEVNRVDQTIGSVLTELEKRGLLASTLIVFAGDNGQALPHGKGSLYDPGSNVPFLVRWPGVVPAGTESRALLSGEDLGPTLLAAAGLEPAPGMTGVNFLPLLRGEARIPRDYIFLERGPRGSASVQQDMTSNGYDLSRAVRSDRYKLIYNCTPWIPYAPVDSGNGPAWREIKSAHAAGTLAAPVAATYFTVPRPVYEFYDLVADPSELVNLSGRPELADEERRLRVAMAEKMITDFDYLPLPAIPSASDAATPGKGKKADRAATFARLDADADGRLSPQEFAAGRTADDAAKWFGQRDADHDGFVSKEEYLPASPGK